MIQRLLLLVFLGCSALASAQTHITPELQDKMDRSPALSLLPVWVLMEEQIDYSQWEADFRARKSSLRERSSRVIQALKQQSAASQAPVLSLIAQHVAARDVRSYWVANMVALQASPQLIRLLDQAPGVRQIQSIPQPQLIPYEVAAGERKVNGIERGLDVIQAPFMWHKGYTGYGRKAFIIDTGTDPRHPALQQQYWGNQVPDKQAFYAKTNIDFPYDCDQHGSHVTGTIMGLDPQTRDTIGVAFDAKWMASPSLRVCLTVIGIDTTTSSLVDAFQWALDPDGNPNTVEDMPDAINNSWHNPWVGDGCENAYKYVFNSLELAGVAVIFANGNEGPEAGTVTKPAMVNTDLTNTFAVGALNGNLGTLPIAEFSSHGPSPCPGEGPLAIKPEVSAPGVDVRSSIPGGGYANFSGTSMASPHVCGAVLLLKQAFPEMPGSILKEALYYSALDLGESGEDNVYGRGLIQLQKAYEYLLNLGLVPVEVVPSETDLQAVHLEIESSGCETERKGSLVLQNTTAAAMPYELQLKVRRGQELVYSETRIDQGAESGFTKIDFQLVALEAGTYTLEATAIPNSGDDRPLNNVIRTEFTILPFTAPEIQLFGDVDAQLCDQSSIALEAKAESEISYVNWYNSPGSTVPVKTGNPALFEVKSTPQSVYGEAHFQRSLGMQANAAGESDYAADTAGLVLKVRVPLVIKTADIEVQENGLRSVILIRLPGKSVVGTKVLTGLKAGVNTISLSFLVSEPGDYALALSIGKNCKYHKQGAYPYVLEDVLSIDKGYGKGVDTAEYRYFYNLKIDYAHPCGRQAYEIPGMSEAATPDFDFLISDPAGPFYPGQQLTFEADPAQADAWHWSFGDGSREQGEIAKKSYAQAGSYPVILCREDQDCYACIEKTVVIDVLSGTGDPAPQMLEVYPNPASGQILVSGFPQEVQKLRWQIANSLGGQVLQGQGQLSEGRLEVSVEGLAPGYYLLQAESGGQRYLSRFVRQ